MASIGTPRRGAGTASADHVLTPGTLTAAAFAVCLAQIALAIPAVLNSQIRPGDAPGGNHPPARWPAAV